MVESVNSSKGLGPYGGGQFNSVRLTEVNFSDLKEGLNEEKVVLGKVTCSVHSEESVPL